MADCDYWSAALTVAISNQDVLIYQYTRWFVHLSLQISQVLLQVIVD